MKKRSSIEISNIPEDKLRGLFEKQLLGAFLSILRPPKNLTTKEWAEQNRVLGSEISAIPGAYKAINNPIMIRVMECLDDPDIHTIIALKSAQIGWTETINNYLGKLIDIDPKNIIIAFPSRGSGTDFAQEKFRPFISSTPCLSENIGNLELCSWNRYHYAGGFIKFVTAGSVTQLKSTPASVVIVEEPDDLVTNLKNQGDSLGILKQRLKTFPDWTLVYGGTPRYKGQSRVDHAYLQSCQYEYQVPCHVCKDFHVLSFDNLKYNKYEDHRIDLKYGEYNPESARYLCPHCKSEWTDDQKNINIREALNYHDFGWKKKYPEKEDIGFHFNELMSTFFGSSFKELAKKMLEAEYQFTQGREEALMVFVNNSKGEAYENKSIEITEGMLRDKALSYPENTVPKNGMVLTMGIDVQHNRFAYVVRAWGDKNNSWLVSYAEILGNILNPEHPVWGKLEAIIKRGYIWLEDVKVKLYPSAISIDSSDGKTAEIVYDFVKRLRKDGYNIMAIKGHSEAYRNQEIYTVPASRPTTKDKKYKTLAETMGVVVYSVGTNRAKDHIMRQLQQVGNTDRMYYYKSVSPVYYQQLLSNSKRLIGTTIKKVRYFKKFGHQDEALDCEVYALHAARSLFVQLRTAEEWQRQREILLRSVIDKPKSTTETLERGSDKPKGLGIRRGDRFNG